MSIPRECPVGSKRPRRKPGSRDHLEAKVIKDCLKLLIADERVVYIERRNTGAARFAEGGFVRFGALGGADIWCVVNVCDLYSPATNTYSGILRHVEIECKRADGKGRQSEAQRDFERRCNEVGIPYFLVPPDDLREKLDELFASR